MDDFDRLVGSMTRAQIQASAESLLRVLEKPDKNGGTFADTSGRLPAMSAAVSAAALLAAAERGTAAGVIPVQASRVTDGLPTASDARGPSLGETAPQPAAEAESGYSYDVSTRDARLTPHDVYENAVGARGNEMGRVSDYFRRDSRRYDTGFERY